VAGDAFQYPWGRLDLGLGRLQDCVGGLTAPFKERRATVCVIGAVDGKQRAVPFGKVMGEITALGCELGD
jgi:hypothetical protein